MRQKGILTTIILSLILLILPTYNKEINAQEQIPEAPNTIQFATKEELMTEFDADISNGENAAKVYFGLNEQNLSQEWWIAGSQDNNSIVLFAASPLIKEFKFDPKFDESKNDPSDWKDCSYLNPNSPLEVDASHYGASLVRDKLQSMSLDERYFSSNEQDLMNHTTIYTDDKYNESKVYSTNDKLYLAYSSNLSEKYIYVGSNKPENLHSGFKVDNVYWNTDYDGFWLRSSPGDRGFAYSGKIKYNQQTQRVETEVELNAIDQLYAIQPVTRLNISNVLFGSTALPAIQQSSDAKTREAFTLRHKSNELGSALILIDKENVELNNVPEETYLVAQNDKGIYSKKINNKATINASEMELSTFENCQVWLEKYDPDQRMTYATMAEQEERIEVDIRKKAEDESLDISENNQQNIRKGTAIVPITVNASRGYSITDDYINKLNVCFTGLGISASRTGNSFTISGIPTQKIDITLPPAIRNKAGKPVVIESYFETTASTIIVKVDKPNELYGNPVYSLNGTNWQTENVINNLSAGKEYNVHIKFSESIDFAQSEETVIKVSTKPATYTISIPSEINLNETQNAEIKLAEESTLDLGYKGKVSVDIVQNDSITDDGCLLLNRNNATDQIKSRVFVNDKGFNNHVVDLDGIEDKGIITLSDPRSLQQKIFAGTYTGKITFLIDYKEDQINE